MTTEANKKASIDAIVAELMALVHKVKHHAIAHNEFDNSVALSKALDDTEQAIRRAVDWGEPVLVVASNDRTDRPPHRYFGPPAFAGKERLPCGTPLYARSTKP